MTSSDSFRAGVGIVVIDGRGMVLALERADVRGAWQLPQGGLDPDEAAIDAAARELAEETSIDWHDVTLVAEHPTWLGYELPAEHRSAKTGRGQVHRWFLVRLDGSPADIALVPPAGHQEFSRWRWITITELVASSWHARRPVYEQLAVQWGAHFQP